MVEIRHARTASHLLGFAMSTPLAREEEEEVDHCEALLDGDRFCHCMELPPSQLPYPSPPAPYRFTSNEELGGAVELRPLTKTLMGGMFSNYWNVRHV